MSGPADDAGPPAPEDGPDDDSAGDESPVDTPKADTSEADAPEADPATADDTEAAPDDEGTDPWERGDQLLDRLGAVSPMRAVLAVTALALLIRLVDLGTRPMHFDEARVAYWSWHYLESGSISYRPVIHGPFIQHVHRWLFAIVGPSDFVARLPIALVGGLLPATALLFREHLEKDEMVAFAIFVGFNSILVYYSRFMRSDVLVAGFMFTAFGLLVRTYDTREPRYVYGAAVLVAMGFAAKENALVYVLTWLGATALVLDTSLFRPRTYRNGFAVVKESWVGDIGRRLLALIRGTSAGTPGDEAGPRLLPIAGHAVGVGLVFVAVFVFFYADRGAGLAGMRRPPTPPSQGAVGLWEALGQPLSFPGYAYETMNVTANSAINHWGEPAGTGGQSASLVDTYVDHISRDLKVLETHGIFLLTFGILGFVWERYGREHSRTLVIFLGYCGIASLLGYPLADDIGGAHWLHVHVLLPMAVPAAVGLAGFARLGVTAEKHRDALGTLLIAFTLVSAAALGGSTMAAANFGDTTSEDNLLAQYAQAEGDARNAIHAVNDVAGTAETDVLVYTSSSYRGRSLVGQGLPYWIKRPLCLGPGWISALPLPWYTQKADASVSCERDPVQFSETVSESQPPVVVTNAPDRTVPRDQLREQYTAQTYDWFQSGHRVTVWVRTDRVGNIRGWSGGASTG